MSSQQKISKDSRNKSVSSGDSTNLKRNTSDYSAYEGAESDNSRSGDLFRKLIDIFDRELGYDLGPYNEIKSSTHTDGSLENAETLLGKYIAGISSTAGNPASEENVKAGKSGFEDEPVVLRPGKKTEGIFNDENLTEDYELGLRFYQLGLKTGFFNVKLDGERNSTRIATAEFFPNKFWPAVKQRSRWIAGICLQNWKAHKWKGNLTTKYFMFRDRKPLLSFMSTFLSYIVLGYFIYLAAGTALGFDNTLLSGKLSPVLMSLMMFNLVFMVSKGFHRFVFTYNWYGFRYAAASLFRLGIDTFINFFAIIRSVSVFRKTKKKVVWDATTHY
ncbi:MAG: hypothetical protein LWX07_00765 [Bacteroidetes bacterium]|nr:hypothetical protein [Bacteroidota bacterium]